MCCPSGIMFPACEMPAKYAGFTDDPEENFAVPGKCYTPGQDDCTGPDGGKPVQSSYPKVGFLAQGFVSSCSALASWQMQR